jgi:predicted metal-binding protein
MQRRRFTMSNKTQTLKEIEKIFQKHGFNDYKWIHPKDVVVAHWVRMKCVFGCPSYGKGASCPPNTPSVAECREFLDEYSDIALFHFPLKVDSSEERQEKMTGIDQKLLRLEQEVFLSGEVKTFLLFAGSCHFCDKCVSSREDCKHPKLARPTSEALAVDVFSTARTVGYPIDVLKDYNETMNRYAFLLVR